MKFMVFTTWKLKDAKNQNQSTSIIIVVIDFMIIICQDAKDSLLLNIHHNQYEKPDSYFDLPL